MSSSRTPFSVRLALTDHAARIRGLLDTLAPRGYEAQTARVRAGILGLLTAEILLLLLSQFVDAKLGLIGAGGLLYAALCWYSLRAAWIVGLSAVPFSQEIVFPIAHSALWVPTEPMVILFLSVWAVRSILRKEFGLQYSPILICVLALAGVAGLSAIQSGYPILSIKAVTSMTWLATFGFFFPYQTDRDGNLLRAGAWILAISAFVLSVFGLLYLAQHGVSRSTGNAMGRPFFPEHGTYASYLCFGLSFLLSLGLFGQRPLWRAVGLAGFGFALLAIVLSVTRAAYLGAGAVLGVFAFYLLRRRTLVPLLLAAALVTVFLISLGRFQAGQFVQLHASSIAQPGELSNLGRINRWLAAGNMVRAHPYLGVGYGAYEDSYFTYRVLTLRTEDRFIRAGVHSEYLEVLAELGWIGFVCQVFFIWFLVREAHHAIRWRLDKSDRWLALGAAGAVASYLIHAFFNNYSNTDKVGVPFWFLVATIAILGRFARRSGEEATRLQ